MPSLSFARKASAGFTLVELAIVMTIIGLLIGGILKGSEMISNAQSKKVAGQITGINAATMSFRDMYGQIPGDFNMATTRLKDCVAPACSNGNGNNIVGLSTGYIITDSQADGLPCANCQQLETVMFWQHLSRADLIAGIGALSGAPSQATLSAGLSHPNAGWDGVIHAATKTLRYMPPNHTWPDGLYLIFRKGIFGTANGCMNMTESTCIASFKEGLMVDRMVDDGNPARGFLIVDGSVDCTAGFMGLGNLVDLRKSCNVMARIL